MVFITTLKWLGITSIDSFRFLSWKSLLIITYSILLLLVWIIIWIFFPLILYILIKYKGLDFWDLEQKEDYLVDTKDTMLWDEDVLLWWGEMFDEYTGDQNWKEESWSDILAANKLATLWVIRDESSNPENYNLWSVLTKIELLDIMISYSWFSKARQSIWIFEDIQKDEDKIIAESAIHHKFITFSDNKIFEPEKWLTKQECIDIISEALIEHRSDENEMLVDFLKNNYSWEDLNVNSTKWWIYILAVELIDARISY